MQFIISAKAGLVNAVDGTANVHVQEMVPAGAPIQTGPSGRVEILLNPGTFLRLGEDSQAVLDSVDLTDVQVRILSGSAVIECISVEKNSPITVTDGTETVSISKPGTYRFPEDAVSDSLEDWSQQRSELIAKANASSAATDAASNNPAFPSPGWPVVYPSAMGPAVYPGSTWPGGLYPGAASPLSYYPSLYPSYVGGYGYSYYQPMGAMVPLVLLYPRPIIPRPLPRPVSVTTLRPAPVTPRPTPVTRPPATPRPAPSHIGARSIGGGGHR